jgi:cobalamin biosynthetic protein CobC
MIRECLTGPAPTHGGDLGAARRLFPDAPQPFIDLSTGINPYAYPLAALAPEAFTRLPEPGDLAELAAIAAPAFGAPSADNVVPAPGTHILVTLCAASLPRGRAAVLGPTYAEHARAAALAGHEVDVVGTPGELRGAHLAIITNPNNPDGRRLPRQALIACADALGAGERLLLVDEAFMEAAPGTESVAGDVADRNLVVLRSFGKFFGLAGVRLGFAVAGRQRASGLRAALGPWPVSGAALAIARKALADSLWMGEMRQRLEGEALELARLLGDSGLTVIGGTPLFQLVEAQAAGALYRRLGRAGILVRQFSEQPRWLRFGLPAGASQWQRLAAALRG